MVGKKPQAAMQGNKEGGSDVTDAGAQAAVEEIVIAEPVQDDAADEPTI